MDASTTTNSFSPFRFLQKKLGHVVGWGQFSICFQWLFYRPPIAWLLVAYHLDLTIGSKALAYRLTFGWVSPAYRLTFGCLSPVYWLPITCLLVAYHLPIGCKFTCLSPWWGGDQLLPQETALARASPCSLILTLKGFSNDLSIIHI